jgi:AraC-like DNA-binding protein
MSEMKRINEFDDNQNFKHHYGNKDLLISVQALSAGTGNKAYRHVHTEYQFLSPITEIPGFFIGDRVFTAQPFTLYFIPAGMEHGLTRDVANIAYTRVLVAREYYEAVARAIPNAQGHTFEESIDYPVTEELITLVRMFKAENRRDQYQSPAVLDRLAYLITAELVRRTVETLEGGNRNLYLQIEEAANYMVKESHKNISIDDLATMTGLSKFYFIRLFTKVKGQTPHAFLLMARIAKARNLLEHTTDSVSTISKKCGFKTLDYFSKAFKRSVGTSPLRYRRASHR